MLWWPFSSIIGPINSIANSVNSAFPRDAAKCKGLIFQSEEVVK
eukprot:12220.XXX_841019_841150_1 [CDS] Oithona nana genome sequencing.